MGVCFGVILRDNNKNGNGSAREEIMNKAVQIMALIVLLTAILAACGALGLHL
jgi:hypothetical protein